jgi:hydroxymethylpyrimidine pyrophosphatase-like HAD family hydrolase
MKNAEAQALAYALEIGAAGVEDANEWACVQLAEAIDPSDEVLTLISERSLANAISLLHVLGADAIGTETGRLVYRWLLNALTAKTLPHARVAEAVVRLARETSAPSEEAANASWYFDDAFYLAETGIYGSKAEVATELESHVKTYSA